jgi:addiction module RelE/StbE family toxin
LIRRVEVSRLALKQLRKAPQHVAAKLLAWREDVEQRGVEVVRKVPGYNDHPLKGELAGKRAIRLSLQWRAVYLVRSTRDGAGVVEFVDVQEIHPHDY